MRFPHHTAPDYLPVLMNLTVVRNDDECVNVTIYDDDLLEGTESFSVRISLATEVPDVSIDINRADVFILDDEVGKLIQFLFKRPSIAYSWHEICTSNF